MQDQHTPPMIGDLWKSLQDLVQDVYLEPTRDPVFQYQSPAQIVDLFDESAPPQQGIGLPAALHLFHDKVYPASVHTWHPLFFNQMSAGASLPAVIGEMLTAMLNCTLSTFEAAPAATVIERVVSRWMAGILGMPEGSSGIFLPGSAMGNLLGLTAARNSRLEGFRTKGLQGIDRKAVIICSSACHYSVRGAAMILGLAPDQVLTVEVNERNEMLTECLEQRLHECDQKGLQPFAVVAVMGNTVCGGLDPLAEVVALCKPRGIHIHVDAAFGGGYALTHEGTEAFKAIRDADTVTWDAHKWLYSPLTCTVLLAPDASLFKDCFSPEASYLFHPQEDGIDLAEDLGHYTILCGKRFHALGLWFMFHAFGEKSFRNSAEGRLSLTHAFADELRASSDYELAYEPILPVLCFRFLPEQVRDWDDTRLNRLQRGLRQKVREESVALFNITQIRGRDYFRFILINPLTTMEDVRPLLDTIRQLGKDLIG